MWWWLDKTKLLKIKMSFCLCTGLIVSACGYVSEYEESVYSHEPVYCYQSLGSVKCYREPMVQDLRRLVNYFGPAPSRYPQLTVPVEPEFDAPAAIDHWVKDPEPVVRPLTQ